MERDERSREEMSRRLLLYIDPITNPPLAINVAGSLASVPSVPVISEICLSHLRWDCHEEWDIGQKSHFRCQK